MHVPFVYCPSVLAIDVLFVRFDANFDVMLLPGNITLSRSVKWSAAERAMLCSIKKFVIRVSALMTELSACCLNIMAILVVPSRAAAALRCLILRMSSCISQGSLVLSVRK